LAACAAKEYFSAPFSLILRSKINENGALKYFILSPKAAECRILSGQPQNFLKRRFCLFCFAK